MERREVPDLIVEQLRRSDREIRDRYPADYKARLLRTRLALEPGAKNAKRRHRRNLFWTLAPFAAALVFLLIFLLQPFLEVPVADSVSSAEAADRKPSPSLHRDAYPELAVYRTFPGGEAGERLAAGRAVRRQDSLHVVFQAAGEPFGMVFSVDGVGTVSVYFPEDGSEAGALDDTGEVRLPRFRETRETAGYETLHFVTADRPFRLEEVLHVVGTETELRLPEGFLHTSFRIITEAR